MKTFLIPLDDSPQASLALPFAATLARAADGRLALVRAVPPCALGDGDPIAAQLRAMAEAESELGATASALAASGVRTTAGLAVDEPSIAILEAARRASADMIVMSAHGWHRTGCWEAGVADRVLRGARVPVMIIPRWAREWSREETDRRILVPLDGSQLAETALTSAVELAQLLDAELVLVRIVDPPHGADPTDACVASCAYLARMAAGLVLGDARACRARVEQGEPVDRIARAARAERPMAIVMASHLPELAIGGVHSSVTVATIDRVTAPVVVVHTGALATRFANSLRSTIVEPTLTPTRP
jgi:nucleotide-binding universal stress UspA family protein